MYDPTKLEISPRTTESENVEFQQKKINKVIILYAIDHLITFPVIE